MQSPIQDNVFHVKLQILCVNFVLHIITALNVLLDILFIEINVTSVHKNAFLVNFSPAILL